jgi:hypothetical protein
MNLSMWNRQTDGISSVVLDAAGRVEAKAARAEAMTQTTDNSLPVIAPVPPSLVIVGRSLILTHRAADPDGVGFTLDPRAFPQAHRSDHPAAVGNVISSGRLSRDDGDISRLQARRRSDN